MAGNAFVECTDNTGLPGFGLCGQGDSPPCGTEDGSRKKECNLRDERTAVRFILNRTGNSKTEIPGNDLAATGH